MTQAQMIESFSADPIIERQNALRPEFLPPDVTIDPRGSWLQIKSAKHFEWTRVRFPVVNLHPDLDGLRILHLSDLHAHGGWDTAFDELIGATIVAPPDLILFTGDFVDDRFDHRVGLPAVQRLMNCLRSRIGTFAILGNHDGDLFGPALAGMNITLIDHRQLCLHSANATLELIGLTGVERSDLDPVFMRTIATRPAGAVRIVMAHYPDVIRKSRALHPDLYLCGHTHGGQICLPGGVPIIRHDSLPRQYCTGIHHAFGTWMITSRGMGFSSRIKARIFCPAEVIEIQLVRATARTF